MWRISRSNSIKPQWLISWNSASNLELAFKGRTNRNQYSGTAYVFSKTMRRAIIRTSQCTQKKAPNVSSNCRVIGYRDDVLVLNFLPPVEAPPNQEFVTQNTVRRQTRACTSREPNLWRPGV
jgi:hypothetical protein